MHIPSTRICQFLSGLGFSSSRFSRKHDSVASHANLLRTIRGAWKGINRLLAAVVATVLFGGAITASGAGPVNPHSNANTTAVYNYISGLTGGTSKRVLSGQNVLWYEPSSNGDTYVNDLIWNLENQTGKFPAIVGADLNDTNTNACILPELVTLAQTTGCIIEIDGGLTYPNQTSGESLDHLLPGGADNAAWITSMQTLAAKLQYLQSCGVTVLYRPLHEMNGSWCPYYTTDTASFQNLWINLYTYMTQTAGLNNLIWVFAPNNAGGSAAYNQLVTHPEYCGTSSTQTVTLNNLTVGHTYQMQVWSAYVNGGNRGIELSGSNGTDSATLNAGTGQYAVGTFTASSTSMSFTGTPAAANTLAGTGWAADGNLNAISVRDISGSSGSQITWKAAQTVGSDSDVLTNGTYFDAALFNTAANGGSALTVNGVTFNIVASGTLNAKDPSGDVALTSQRTLNTGGNSPSGPPSSEPYYPGSAYVDIVGSDCYGDNAAMTEYAWFNQLGKPIYYTEFGNGPGSSAGTYNGTYNFETQLMPVIKNTYPNIVGFMAWSDWSQSGSWIYKSIARDVDGGMMNDSWTITASDLVSKGLSSPVTGLTGYYQIINQSNGQALTCDSFTAGATTSVSTYGDNLWQQWGLAPDESGSGYTITDQWSGQVLICPSPGTSGTTQIEQYGEASWEYKTWNITSNGDGTYTIYNAHYPTECLALSGTNVVISTYTGSSSQKWALTPLYATTASFQQGLHGYNGYTGPTYTGAASSFVGTGGTNDEAWNLAVTGTGSPANSVAVSFMEFNLGTTIPAGSRIISATLTFCLSTTWSSGSDVLYTAPITSTWNPATVTGTTAPSFNTTSAVGTVIPNLTSNGGAQIGTLTVNVTNIVQSWINGTLTNNGFAFYSDGTYTGLKAWGVDEYNITSSGQDQCPILTITYMAP
jgi:Glycosyl hydrolase family 26/Ricin-type beta-trefoil lectin domain-like